MKFNYRVSNTNTTINRMLIQGELSYAETWLYQRLFPLELKHQFLLALEAINVNSSIPAKNLLFSYATPCFFSKATTCKISALLENWQDIAILIFIEGCSWNIGKVTLNDQEVFFFLKQPLARFLHCWKLQFWYSLRGVAEILGRSLSMIRECCCFFAVDTMYTVPCQHNSTSIAVFPAFMQHMKCYYFLKCINQEQLYLENHTLHKDKIYTVTLAKTYTFQWH